MWAELILEVEAPNASQAAADEVSKTADCTVRYGRIAFWWRVVL
jgi:hypothetical protein